MALLIPVTMVLLGIALLATVYWVSRPSSEPKPTLVLVTAHKLNCRASPSTEAQLVGVAERGETLTLVGQSGSWRRVQLRGAACWVSGDYLQPTG
jgi:uncharacterized protein YraI